MSVSISIGGELLPRLPCVACNGAGTVVGGKSVKRVAQARNEGWAVGACHRCGGEAVECDADYIDRIESYDISLDDKTFFQQVRRAI